VTPLGRKVCVTAVAIVRVNAVIAAIASGDRVIAASLAGRDTLLHEGAAESTIGALIAVLANSARRDTLLRCAVGVYEWRRGLYHRCGRFSGVDDSSSGRT